MSKSNKEKSRIENIRNYKNGSASLNKDSIKIKEVYTINEIPFYMNKINKNNLRLIKDSVKRNLSPKIKNTIENFGKRFKLFDFTYDVNITVNNNKVLLSAYFYLGKEKKSKLIHLGSISFFDINHIDVSNTFLKFGDIKEPILNIHMPYYSAEGEYLLENSIKDRTCKNKKDLNLYFSQIHNIFKDVIDIGYLFNEYKISFNENIHKDEEFDFFEVPINIYFQENKYILNFQSYEEISCITDLKLNIIQNYESSINVESFLSSLYESNAFLLKKSLTKEDLIKNLEGSLEQYMIMNY